MTQAEAALFTDGRYFLQASQQLDDNWTLMKQGLPNVPTWQEYLVNVSFFFVVMEGIVKPERRLINQVYLKYSMYLLVHELVLTLPLSMLVKY